jgi:hypothetical protein
MKPDPDVDHQIRRYLLAAISEAEREGVETRLMTDDDFFRQIDLVEDELVEEYLDKELDAADRRRFEEVFLAAPERQQKLRFTRALRRRAAEAAEQAARDKQARRWWEGLLAGLDVSRPALAWSLAAALLVMAAGGSWLVFQVRSQQEQISGMQAQLREKDLVESSLRAQVRQGRGQIAPPLQGPQNKQVTVGLGVAPSPWITLTGGALRSEQQPPVCKIQTGQELVRLKLDLAENRKESYRAILLGDDREILARSDLKADESETEITISLLIPAADLPGGACRILLYGSGEKDPLEVYSFVVKK